MSWIGRFANLFRRDRLSEEIDEELAAHIEEAVEHGRSAQEARRALGGVLLRREQSRDMKLLPWLDALVSDVVFGWRQLHKHRGVSAVAILSLALAIGATTAAFRLVDAVLLRTLPVAEPQRLFFLAATLLDPRDGHPDSRDDFDYPTFLRYREILKDRADLVLVGMNVQRGAAFGSGDELEPIYQEYVSGNFFGVLGLQPALGRLLTPGDDLAPGAHPLAVLSYDYWSRRFGRDPKAIGQTFRMRDASYEVAGVAPKGFTGMEPGTVADVFVPATMNTEALHSPGWSWFRICLRLKAGLTAEQVRQPLLAALAIEHRRHLQTLDSDTPRQTIEAYLSQSIVLLPAGSGASEVQKEYRRPLAILAVLVALVLLIACVNVGNLLTAQAAARSREMALRVSIGAGRSRLIQLVLVESALLAAAAAAIGGLFAWWVAPLIVSMLAPAEQPVRLVLDADWRAAGFGCALTATVILLFGLAPALRASAVKPMIELKGGADPRSQSGLMNSLIAVQVAFCVLVIFVAGLFVRTFERLSNRALGFSPQHLLVLVSGVTGKPQPPEIWGQVVERLRQMAGVQSVAVAGWAPLTGNHWTGTVRVRGRAPDPVSPYILDVSPGFFETMRIGWIDGRDFRPGDVQPSLTGNSRPSPGVGIVNEAFARRYFDGQNPVGRAVEMREGKDLPVPLEIVGYVRDACYSNVRERVRPTVYFPIEAKRGGSFIVRTAGDPLAMAPLLRREITLARPEFRVQKMETQIALVQSQMVRERLLATLSLFFAAVALVLAGVGLCGVLNYSVVRRRREIGIHIALGARRGDVVRRVTAGMFGIVCLGLLAGLAGGVACGRFAGTLLFEVKAGDPETLVTPILMLLAAAVLAALPPALRAARIDPARILRSE